jgi:hypothetical protein
MKDSRFVVRPLFVVGFGMILPLLAGCPKKHEDAPDAGPVAVAVVPDAAPVVLDLADAPDAEVAMVDAGPAKHATGPAGGGNAARIRQCCAAIRRDAKGMGSSPEANILIGVATQCDMAASQSGASGTAPEMAVVRNMLHGKNLPALCAGL